MSASRNLASQRGRPTSSRRAKRAGARGLKVLKVLGLFLRERVDAGPLVAVDDPRFDPMWEACGALGLPVAIHVSDPFAFFLPVDARNERYEELNRHPDWSFHGKDYPSNAAILAARDRVLARHPKTTFIGLHVAHSSEDLAGAAAALDRFPNLHVEIGARIGELGRQPRASRRFFERYQDRILFGTDGPQDALYPIYFRFLETEDEYFEYSPGPIPSQGRWGIYGLGLSDQILKKVYSENAERLLSLAPLQASAAPASGLTARADVRGSDQGLFPRRDDIDQPLTQSNTVTTPWRLSGMPAFARPFVVSGRPDLQVGRDRRRMAYPHARPEGRPTRRSVSLRRPCGRTA